MNAPFRVEADTDADLRTVRVVGELDQGTAPELRTALAEALADERGAVLVDLSECDFIDSTGLSLLVESKRRLSAQDRRFAVCCADSEVRRLLGLTGIDTAIGVYGTKAEAAATLSSAEPAA